MSAVVMEKVGPAAPQQQPPQPQPQPQTRTHTRSRTHPFVHELKLSTAQKIRALLLGAVLCPLRLALASLCFALMWPVARLRLLGLTAAERSRPVEGWRRWLLHPLMLLLSRASFLCLGFLWVEVKGRRAHLREAPVLVVAPHSSFLDMMVLCHSQLATVVSRSENTSIPVIGALLEFNQSVLVSRKDPESRKQAVAQLSERLTSNGYWPQMLMFPEGTTTNGQALIQFKPGAFLSGVPVQPVLLRYPNKLDTVRWTYKGTSWWEVLWYTSSQLYTKMTIEFLPVYKPSQEERDDPNLYAHNVQKIMAEALGVPATDYVMEGGVPVSKVGGLSLPLESPAREALALLRRDGLAASDVEEALARVIEKCRVLGGQGSKVGAEELAATLGLADRRTAQDICELYSRDGMLELRQLYLSVSAVAGFVSFRSLLHSAFTLFDGEGGGSLRQEELRHLMGALLGLPQHSVAQLHAEACGSDGRLTQEALLKVLTSHPTFGRVASEHLWPQGAESGLVASSRTAADNNGNVTHGTDSAHGKKLQ